MSNTDDKSLVIGCLGAIIVFVLLWVATGNFIVAIVIGFGLGLVSNWLAKKRKDTQVERDQELLIIHMKTAKNFQVSQYYISEDKKSLIAVDSVNKKFCFVDDRHGGRKKVYSYEDLLRSEIVEDGVAITNTSRTIQIGGAVIGGMLAGGAGAMVGALTGSQNTSSHVKLVTLQVTLDDLEEPVRYIRFLYKDSPIPKDSERYQIAIREANHWHGMISIYIRNASKEQS
ncbi:hypothetical protein HP548_23595 [Paenibacillus taichungensis]|uniref:Uncharacterized protein n=1 Tax=Paenibacillus taichungensis TaxID=484184 RepID=A0ABX2MSP5_9BACL|nr:hypothetical protein [Paenibacillus taichungensis]NUU57069.1 hypothetical protein [Paenibacillus taichungensis]